MFVRLGRPVLTLSATPRLEFVGGKTLREKQPVPSPATVAKPVMPESRTRS